MKKEVRKYTVIEHLTEDGIWSIGNARWIRKNVWWMIIYAVVLIGIGAILTAAKASKLSNNIFLGCMVVILIIGFIAMLRSSSQFFNRVKNIIEPIDIDEVK